MSQVENRPGSQLYESQKPHRPQVLLWLEDGLLGSLCSGTSQQSGSFYCTCYRSCQMPDRTLIAGDHVSYHNFGTALVKGPASCFSFFWSLTALTTTPELPSSTTFICATILSAAWQISSVFLRVSSLSRSRRSLVFVSRIPKTSLSLSISSGVMDTKSQFSAISVAWFDTDRMSLPGS